MSEPTPVVAATSAGTGRSARLRTAGGLLIFGLWVAAFLVAPTLDPRLLEIVLIPVLVFVTITDLEERRIPNRVTVPASFAALLIGLLHLSGLPAQVLFGLGTGLFLFAFAVLSGGGLGMGDVKLGIVLGLFLGKYVILALSVGLLASSVLSVGVLIRRGLAAGRKTWIPLGPFLALGGVIALLGGHALLPGL